MKHDAYLTPFIRNSLPVLIRVGVILLVMGALTPLQAQSGHRHADPNETCFICDPSKRDPGRLWCKGHARYEDRCWLCHPELEDPDRLYCEEHGLYEDECFLCHPELAEDANEESTKGHVEMDSHAGQDHGADAHAGHGHAAGGLFCNEHGVYESECAICHPELAATLKPGEAIKIRLPSTEAATKAGIGVGRAHTRPQSAAVRAFAEIQYNLNALARVTPLTDGVIRAVHRDVGDEVQAGETLAELHSAELASAKSRFLSAAVDLEIKERALQREQRLREQNIGAEKDYFEAEGAFRTAQLTFRQLRQKLINLGLTESETETIRSTQDTSATLMLRAPFAGTLIDRQAVVGESAHVGDALFTVADLSTRWIQLSVPSGQMAQIHRGQKVEARFNELPGVVVEGEITWVSASVDSRTRMVQARALATSSARTLPQGLYGEARILNGGAGSAAVLPRDAVQQHEGMSFVFVQEEPDLFALRRVAIGAADGENVEVVAGLVAADVVVTSGSFIVMSEFLKSRLGAGCAGH